MSTKCFYKILGITKKASQQEIKTAYYQLCKQFHPDVYQSLKTEEDTLPEVPSDDKFREITEAYLTLNNELKRKKYDILMGYIPPVIVRRVQHHEFNEEEVKQNKETQQEKKVQWSEVLENRTNFRILCGTSFIIGYIIFYRLGLYVGRLRFNIQK